MKFVEQLLSRLFPPRHGSLKRSELNQTLGYRRRMLFANGYIHVWSSITGRARLQFPLQNDTSKARFNHRVYDSVLEHFRDTTTAGTRSETQATNQNGAIGSRLQSRQKLVRYN